MYVCERWTIKKAEWQRIDAFELWCWRIGSHLDSKEIKPFNPKGNQSWIFIGRTGAEAEALILWPPNVKNWLIGKDPDAGKDWRQDEKGTTENKLVGWHHWLKIHEFEQALGAGDGQGSLVCCSPWGSKESDMTETELNWSYHLSICKDIYYKELAHFILGASRPKFYRGVHQPGNFGRNGCSRLEAEFLFPLGDASGFTIKVFQMTEWGQPMLFKVIPSS